MSEPWERQRGESRQAFAAFAAYRDMGQGRSMQRVANELSKSMALMKRWSARWSWGERAGAWDAELDRQVRLGQIEAIAEMNERHIAVARMMLGIVEKRLETIEPHTLSPKDAAQWADLCSKLERLARGEATERVDVIQRVRQLARQLGLPSSEEAKAVAAAEKIVRGLE